MKGRLTSHRTHEWSKRARERACKLLLLSRERTRQNLFMRTGKEQCNKVEASVLKKSGKSQKRETLNISLQDSDEDMGEHAANHRSDDDIAI